MGDARQKCGAFIVRFDLSSSCFQELLLKKTFLFLPALMTVFFSVSSDLHAQASGNSGGPFGLRWGMNAAEIEQSLPIREKKVDGRHSYYSVNRVLGPYPSGTEHLLVVDEKYGLQAASASIPINNDDPKASRTLNLFRAHAEQMKSVFGDPVQLAVTYDANQGKSLMACFELGCSKATGSWKRSGISAGIDVIGQGPSSALVAIRFWGPNWANVGL